VLKITVGWVWAIAFEMKQGFDNDGFWSFGKLTNNLKQDRHKLIYGVPSSSLQSAYAGRPIACLHTLIGAPHPTVPTGGKYLIVTALHINTAY